MIGSLFVGGTAGAAGSTLNVCTDGCAYSSIQDAIDDAGTDDTIQIEPGTYAEVLTIPASKSGLTLSGAGEDVVTVDGSASSSYALEIAADDVTVEGITLVGPSSGVYGIHAADTPEDLTGLTIQEITVRESASSEIDLHAVNGASVRDVELYGAGTGGNGFAVTDSHDVTVEGLTTSGNTWGGFAIYTSGSFAPAGTSGITLTGNNSLAETNPVYIQGDHSKITNLDIQGYPVELVFGNEPAFKFLQPSVDAAVVAAPAIGEDGRLDLDTAVIEDTRDGSLHATDGMSLQTAVDAADPGDEVVAHGGTYDEALDVDVDALTLAGEDGATVTDTVTVGADGVTLEDLDIETGGNDGVQAGGTIADLTLDGVRIADADDGLRVGTANGIDGLTITGDSVFEGNDIGIYFAHHPYNGPSTPLTPVTDVLIEDTQFLDHDRKGLYVETLDDAVIRNVTVRGVTSDAYGFNNGIDINLKADDYSDITIEDTVVEDVSEGDPFRDNAAFSAAVAIKARDDGSTYGAAPATLDNLTIRNTTVRDSFNGLRIGEPGVDYTENDAPTNVTVRQSAFANLEGFGLVHLGENTVDASHNWWNSPTGPSLVEATDGPLGELVDGNVDFAPFCLVPSCVVNSAVHGSPAPHVSAGALVAGT